MSYSGLEKRVFCFHFCTKFNQILRWNKKLLSVQLGAQFSFEIL